MSIIEREHRPAFLVLFVSFVLFGTSVTVIGAVLPRVLADFAWDYLAAGSVIAAGSLGYFLSAYVAGRLVDRIGFRASMAAGLTLDAIGLLAFAATPSAPLNAFLYFLVGVGQGFIEVAVNWSIVKMAPERPGSHGGNRLGDCNDCTYSSVVLFAGVVRLYCGLCGRPLDALCEGCERSKGAEAMARDGWQPWAEGERA